jgi:HD-like signal output (HDOD) protein
VLRVANSAYYGKQRSITTIRRAVFVLGLDAVRGVAAAACVDRAAPRRGRRLLPDIPAFLGHTLATAVGAELLSRYNSGPLAAEAFVAGVLHNLGVAVQACLDAEGVQAIVQRRGLDPISGIRQLELDCAAVQHEECIAIVLSDWQLPPSLVAAARHHHDPLEAPEPYRKLACVVSLGASLALASGHTYSLEPAPLDHDAAALDLLEISSSELEETRGQVRERVAELQSALGGE